MHDTFGLCAQEFGLLDSRYAHCDEATEVVAYVGSQYHV